MNRIAFVLAVLVGACAHASRDSAPPPPPPTVESYIADYLAPADTLFVREANGQLEVVYKGVPQLLQQVAGDTFLISGEQVVLSGTPVRFGGTYFDKRVPPGMFRIQPQRSIEELRVAAQAATPPAQPDTLLSPDLVELQSLDPSIKYDIRYATTNNFMGAVFYAEASAKLQRPVAEALMRAHHKLNQQGYGLLIFDAYRPWYVTKMFWDATPDSLRNFVADPAAGSRHNRGAAVDLTLYDLASGEPVEMPSGYDEFSDRAFPNYPGGTSRQRWHRDLLRSTLEAEGFTVFDYEWWHFDFQNWRQYPVQ